MRQSFVFLFQLPVLADLSESHKYPMMDSFNVLRGLKDSITMMSAAPSFFFFSFFFFLFFHSSSGQTAKAEVFDQHSLVLSVFINDVLKVRPNQVFENLMESLTTEGSGMTSNAGGQSC